MFVDPTNTVPVRHGENTIYVRSKMDLSTQAAVQDELVRFRLAANADGEDTFDATFSVDRRNLALLRHNIESWEGPEFDGVPCTPDRIAMLDVTEPIVQKAIETIEALNEPRTEDMAEPDEGGDEDPNG